MANSIQSISLPPQAHAALLGERTQGPDKQRAAAVEDDSLKVSKPTSQQVLNDKIMEAIGTLNGYLKTEGFQTIEQLDPAEFTPEKVSDRILNFIDLAMKRAEAKGADTGELEKMREQARAGVEEGYKKAYDMLDGLGMLQGKVKEDVEKTYDLLQQGLDRMDRGEPLVLAPPPPAEGGNGLSANARAESRSLSLEIQTNDGDKVTINLQRSSSSAAINLDGQNGEGGFSVRMEQRQSDFSFDYQVQGNLDKDEEKAIRQLLKDVDKLANDFFSGATPDLLKTSLKNGFNSDELTSFSLNMSQSQSVIAARAYQNVESMGDEGQGRGRPGGIPPGQLLQQLRDTLDGPGLALGRNFPDPASVLKDLLVSRLSLDPRFEDTFGSGNPDKPETPQTLVEQMFDATASSQPASATDTEQPANA